MRASIQRVAKIYGMLLCLFPRDFQNEFKQEMVDVFTANLADAEIATQLAAWHETKKPRPRTLIGSTFRVETPLGKAFVTVNQNGGTGLLSSDPLTSGQYKTSDNVIATGQNALTQEVLQFSYCVSNGKMNWTPKAANPTFKGWILRSPLRLSKISWASKSPQIGEPS